MLSHIMALAENSCNLLSSSTCHLHFLWYMLAPHSILPQLATSILWNSFLSHTSMEFYGCPLDVSLWYMGYEHFMLPLAIDVLNFLSNSEIIQSYAINNIMCTNNSGNFHVSLIVWKFLKYLPDFVAPWTLLALLTLLFLMCLELLVTLHCSSPIWNYIATCPPGMLKQL